MTTNFQVHIDRIRRRVWIVVAFAILGLVIGLYSAYNADTTYSSKAALTVLSDQRAPEQDAILGQGYAEVFNDPAYQPELRRRAGVPESITFTALPTLASPIVGITASADNTDQLSDAAAKMSIALRDSVNDALQLGRDATVATVQKPLDDIRAANGIVPEQALVNLQDRISELNANSTNELLAIPMDSAISESKPDPVMAIALPLIGGLVIGCFVALAMGALSRRFTSEFDVTNRTGLPVLTEVPGGRGKKGAAARDRSLGQLANTLANPNIPRPAVVAIASTSHSEAVQSIARSLAEIRAGQGVSTILVDADMRESGPTPGLAEYLSRVVTFHISDVTSRPNMPYLREIGRGSKPDNRQQIGSERINAATADLRHNSAFAVVVTSPLLESAEAQAFCGAADFTILILERSKSTTTEVAAAQRLIDHVDGHVLGTVLVDAPETLQTASRPGPVVTAADVVHTA
ncbi:hypothetical protein [Aldersonia kunmingensis]|uniref:hypothetical protein n=1 Tax=Aldersonia kunmingensis TaxID=408066 RepID=UPI00082B328A|nr:hypothetical protein [Aldersonia kunmingensis]